MTLSNQEIMPSYSMIAANARVCDECIEFINSFSAEIYRSALPSHSSIGSHIRHAIEFFECLIAGSGSEDRTLDYDKRSRNTRLENDKAYAISTLENIKQSILGLQAIDQDIMVKETVSIEQADHPAVKSTLARELMFAHSHMVHHFGIIKLLAEIQGVSVKADFGKAPSTIVFEKSGS